MKADMNRAIAFVQQQGTRVENAQLHYTLNGEAPSEQIQTEFFAEQRPEGSWSPFWAPEAASIDATCYRVLQASYMGLTPAQSPELQRALRWLQQRQSSDGSWREKASLQKVAPLWANPANREATLYLTANCGWTLVRFTNNIQAGQLAIAYLLQSQTDTGRLPSFIHTHWLTAGLCLLLGQEEPVYQLLEYVRTRVELGLSSDNLVWLLNCLQDSGLPTTHPLLQTAAEKLEYQQHEDGTWASDDNDPFTVQTTLETIRALHRFL